MSSTRRAKGKRASEAIESESRKRGKGGPSMKEAASMRKFWEKFDTQLLFTWIYDFRSGGEGISSEAQRLAAEMQLSRAADREYLLALLVVQQEELRPPEGAPSTAPEVVNAALEELRMIWQQHNASSAHLPLSSCPGLFTSASIRRKRKAAVEVSDSEGDVEPQSEDEEEEEPQAKSTEILRKCMTCLKARTDKDDAPEFMCLACGLRGDLPADHAANKVLLAIKANGAKGAAADENNASTGQVKSAEARHKSRRELVFKMYEAKGPPFVEFTKSKLSEAAVLVASALEENRAAYDAIESHPPDEALISLIQSGKLPCAAWAIPRPQGVESDEAGKMVMDANGQIALSAEKTIPMAQVPSERAFCLALVSSILPALVGQPLAASQWLSLARSVLNLSANFGWEAAQSYLSKALAENVRNQHKLSVIVAAALDKARELRITASTPATPARPIGASSPAAAASANSKRGDKAKPCRAYNSAKTCLRDSCIFGHFCALEACNRAVHSSWIEHRHDAMEEAKKAGGSVGPNKRASGSASSVATTGSGTPRS